MNFLDFEEQGFVLHKRQLDESLISELIANLSGIPYSCGTRRRNGSIFGIRNLLNLSEKLNDFAHVGFAKRLADEYFPNGATPIRAIYFDKTSNANWKVPWHQDLTISVRQKNPTEGFTAWSTKAGIEHVQPPVEILEGIVTFRFHLDAADNTNGALKVLPGTHKFGRLSANEIQWLKVKANSLTCAASKGDVLVMRPLLVHSSSVGSNPSYRRVIHIEYSDVELPNGLDWYGS